MPAFGRHSLFWIVGWWPVWENKLLTFYYSWIRALSDCDQSGRKNSSHSIIQEFARSTYNNGILNWPAKIMIGFFCKKIFGFVGLSKTKFQQKVSKNVFKLKIFTPPKIILSNKFLSLFRHIQTDIHFIILIYILYILCSRYYIYI